MITGPGMKVISFAVLRRPGGLWSQSLFEQRIDGGGKSPPTITPR
jgi:hypothetical protein